MMRARSAGLVLFALAGEAAGECKVDAPTGNWKQGAVYQAVAAGEPRIEIPEKWEGFNRTVSLEGICQDSATTSEAFVCKSGGSEVSAGLASLLNPIIKLHFGAATCPLSGISVYKTGAEASSKFEAELRLEFDECQGAASTSSAAVVVGVRKDQNEDFGIMKWTKEVCGAATTTTVAPVAVFQETDAISQEVGEGSCNATERRRIDGVTSEADCKLQCLGSSTAAHALGKTGCTGFAFNAASSTPCITYSGSFTATEKNDGWKCFSLSYAAGHITKSTAPPPLPPPKKIPQQLKIAEALGVSSIGYLKDISPPADAPGCFPASHLWWFELQDTSGAPLSVAVHEDEWDEFMAGLPEAKITKSVVSAPTVLDRVIFSTCTQSGWGQATCYVAPPPETGDSPCRNEELSGAVISGVSTSVLTWILVGAAFQLFKMASKTSSKGPEYERIGGSAGMLCAGPVIPILCTVAAGGACICCYLSMQFLQATFRSASCYSNSEFLVVVYCVAVSVAVSILLLLMFMHQVAPYHAHEVGAVAPQKEAAKSHLIMLEVPEGQGAGTYHPTLAPQAGGGSANGSTNAPGGPAFVPAGPGTVV